jgi:hypothetical protein
VPENLILDDLVTFEDLHATLLQYGGAPIPPDHDGVSLMPRIEGWSEAARDHVIGIQDLLRVREDEWVPGSGFNGLLSHETASYLRTDTWRYIEWLDRGEQALFRIEEDPFERTDLSAEHPELLARFSAHTAAWREELARPTEWMDFMGRLMAEDGTPAGGLRLWLEGTHESGVPLRLEVITDTRGFFRFPNVPAATYALTYEIERLAKGETWGRVRSAPVTQSIEVDLVGYETSPYLSIRIPGEAPPAPMAPPRPGTIEIEIQARGGAETSGVPMLLRGWTKSGLVEQRVLSGPDSFVVLDQLPPGLYSVRVTGSHRVRGGTRWVYLRPGARELLEITLRKAGTRRMFAASRNYPGYPVGSAVE